MTRKPASLQQALSEHDLVALPDEFGVVIYTDADPPVWVGRYWPNVDTMWTQVVFRFGDTDLDKDVIEEAGQRAADEQLGPWEEMGFVPDHDRLVRRWDTEIPLEWTFAVELRREDTAADEVAGLAAELIELGKFQKTAAFSTVKD